MSETRIFEGELGRENELRSQDAYLVISREPIKLVWCQAWLTGLYGKRVHITVEVIEEKPVLPDKSWMLDEYLSWP